MPVRYMSFAKKENNGKYLIFFQFSFFLNLLIGESVGAELSVKDYRTNKKKINNNFIKCPRFG